MTVAQQLADGGVVLRETVPSSDVVRARFGDVDGLRALAIVAIVAFQTVRFIGLPARTPPAIAQLFGDASQGFALFLMLSAFSLAYPILAARRTDGATYLDIGRYAVKRLLRIYPAFLAVLGIALATHPLAAALHWTALANAVPAIPVSSVLRNAVFLDGGFGGFADGAGNDGFAALALVARGFILLPVALFGWLRAPRITVAVAVFAAALDVLTPAHAFTLSAVLPLVLGIVAADMRVQHHRLQRFGLPLALGAAVVAFFAEPYLALMAGTVAAPDALRVDPFWSIALFGLVAAAGFSGRLEAVLGFPPLRLLGAAAYGISLVAMPVAALATRMLPERLSFGALAAATAAEEFGVGIVVWLAVDRWFAGDGLRRRAAEGPGAWLDGILAKVRASRVVFAAPAPAVSEETEPVELRVVPPPAAFYAPPPRPATDIPLFSTRTGSADDLAAEILQTKARLGELSAAVLDPEPRPAPPDADPYAKPGFYRRPPQPSPASAARLATAAVAPPKTVAAPAAVAPVAAAPVAAAPVAAAPVAAASVAASVAAAPVAAASVAAASVASAPVAEASVSAAVAMPPAPVETPSAGSGRSADMPSVDEPDPSPATSAVTTPAAAAASAAVIPTERDVRADVPGFDGGAPAMPPLLPIESELERIATAHSPLPDRSGASISEVATDAAPAPASTASAFEPVVTRSTADVSSEAPAPATPAEIGPRAVEPRPEAPAAAASAHDWARAVEPAPPSFPAPADALARAVEIVPAAPSSAGAEARSLSAPADGRVSAVAPLSKASVDDFGAEEPAAAASRATHDGERVDDGPTVPERPFPSSYDGESPLEMLRAAYPPIDESPVREPATNRVSASQPPHVDAASQPPQENELVTVTHEPSDLSVSGPDPATAHVPPDDRSAYGVETSLPPVPAAPVPAASAVASLSLVALSETAIQPARPSGVIFRPVVKASLLVRVFKHARAKFKPVASSAPGTPAAPPIPIGRQPVTAGRDASAAPAGLPESHAARPVATTGTPARTAASAPATASPGRSSIRMRIGPTARISRPDGDNG